MTSNIEVEAETLSPKALNDTEEIINEEGSHKSEITTLKHS